MSAGLWETAQAIRASEGLRSALAYTEGEIRHLVSSGDCDSALQLTKLLVSFCNREALTQGKDEAVVTLRRAKTALDYIERQRSGNSEALFRLQLLTCSNLASVLKDLGDSRRALQYLLAAQEIIETRQVTDSVENLQCIASTKVNISTMLLTLKQYSDAIAFAEQCLHLLQLRLALTSSSLSTLAAEDSEKFSSMLRSYLSAMFNIAVAEEALGRRDAAVKSYSACVKFGKTYMAGKNSTVEEAETAIIELLGAPSDREMTTAPTLSSRPQLAVKPPPPLKTPHKPTTPNTSYYSRERLLHVHRALTKSEEKSFISSSQYFNMTVTKNLKLEEDVQHLAILPQKDLVRSIRLRKASEVDPDKQSLAELRKRKYKKRGNSRDDKLRGLDYIQKRISALHSEGKVQLSSSHRLSASLTARRIESRKATEARPSEATAPSTRIQSRLVTGKTKEEIEAMAEELQTEIKSLSASSTRRRSPQPTTCSQLAASMSRSRTTRSHKVSVTFQTESPMK